MGPRAIVRLCLFAGELARSIDGGSAFIERGRISRPAMSSSPAIIRNPERTAGPAASSAGASRDPCTECSSLTYSKLTAPLVCKMQSGGCVGKFARVLPETTLLSPFPSLSLSPCLPALPFSQMYAAQLQIYARRHLHSSVIRRFSSAFYKLVDRGRGCNRRSTDRSERQRLSRILHLEKYSRV